MNIRKRISILFVPSGTKIAPATRYRINQYLPYLDKEFMEYSVYSIISHNMTLRMIKSPTYNALGKLFYYIGIVAEKFIRGLKIIYIANKFDIVYLQRTTFMFGLEKLLKIRNKNIIFDIDDSIYMPDNEENGILGALKKSMKRKEVSSVLKITKCVIVENRHIKNFVRQYCNNIYLITGPIDSVKNYTKEYRQDAKEIAIGWIGSPSTTPYLNMLNNVFVELSKKYKIKVMLIGAAHYEIEGLKIENIPWQEETEVFQLHKFDIGIMPMPDDEWTRGKVGCKMLQYMANAIPAVVSYTPTNAEIIEDGVNGFLARSESQWVEKMSLLIESFDLRQMVGKKGRQAVEEKFSLQVNFPKLKEVLENCIKN